ncbi:MAG: CBS domain-containing protein [Aestuariivirga sp.]|uniref:CBS domain-containing protein n=1 Tax=Aestuariivirga sp. TaxID=2650926 RepID=UPI0025C457E7|nr:CBS domain-containing protein [Aestuariivirga sp.]MCA3560897.1 CBS domain-containing protein [Aestuariivirga sp.]
MAVAHILRQKGTAVVTVAPSDNVQSIVDTLARHRIGAVVVLDAEDAIAGIVSERDIVRAMAGDAAGVVHKTARDIMTARVRTCTPADSETELMQLMTEHRIRHLPVVAHGKLAGMISIGDVVKLRMESMEAEADQMKIYIASAG